MVTSAKICFWWIWKDSQSLGEGDWNDLQLQAGLSALEDAMQAGYEDYKAHTLCTEEKSHKENENAEDKENMDFQSMEESYVNEEIQSIEDLLQVLKFDGIFDYLDAPVERINGVDVPTPYVANLERLDIPQIANETMMTPLS